MLYKQTYHTDKEIEKFLVTVIKILLYIQFAIAIKNK